MEPIALLALIILGVALLAAIVTAFFVKGKAATITTVTIDAKNVYQRLVECAKLATAEVEFSQVWRIKEQKKLLWGLASSTKNFEVDYIARTVAGLDLGKSGLEIDIPHRTVFLKNPQCEIIAIELDLERSREAPGFFNMVTPEDRDRYLKGLKDHVRQIAIERGLLLTAERKAIESLSGLTQSMGLRLVAGEGSENRIASGNVPAMDATTVTNGHDKPQLPG